MSKYFRVYNSIIIRAKNSIRSKSDNTYYESHHIIPTALGGDDKQSNKVLLTAREHYIAHHLLFKHYQSTQQIFEMDKMAFAFNQMTWNVNGKRYNSKSFSIARKAMAEAISRQNKGKKLSQAHKDKLSKAATGRKMSQESIDKKRETFFRNQLSQTSKLAQLTLDGDIINTFNSQRDAARQTKINQSSISKQLKGLLKHAGGFIFKYVEVT